MGKAGKALKQVLETYGIAQSRLAEELGVERPIVFRWFHEQTDPTAETVVNLVRALRQIERSAASDFVEFYLGDSTQPPPIPESIQLPESDRVDVATLARIFDNTTTSYKYLFFLSLLDILNRRQFDVLSPISFYEIVVEMLANAWYPHNYFKLSFGSQDEITNKLDALRLEITEPILSFKDTDKKQLRQTIREQNLHNIVKFIGRYVPFRLIRPFFEGDLRGVKDYKINQSTVDLSEAHFADVKPLYKFDAQHYSHCSAIVLNQDWVAYLRDNYAVVRGWAAWEWLQYMQQRNPSTPNVVNKLFMPQHRGSLATTTKFWKSLLKENQISCIYSSVEISPNNMAIDHFLPWSFVAHDRLWNLLPVLAEANSAKSNRLPSQQYIEGLVQVQHLSLNYARQTMKDKAWGNHIEAYIEDLNLNSDDLLRLDILRNAYESTLKPLMSLAEKQGFSGNWLYQR